MTPSVITVTTVKVITSSMSVKPLAGDAETQDSGDAEKKTRR
jgi:hypothetical protein